MSEKQELQVREKKELKEYEGTREGLLFTPEVDIFETDRGLMLIADVPGASGNDIDLDLRNDTLDLSATIRTVETRWKPIYQEYEVGSYARQFRIGQVVDKDKISAQVKDGVLTLELPKVEKAQPRKIVVKHDE